MDSSDGVLTDVVREQGVRSMVREAAWSNMAATVTAGAIPGAFAVYMGAPNAIIGLIAAAPFLSQLLQAPTVALIERVKSRRVVAVWASVVGRAGLAAIAVSAFWPGEALALLVVVIMNSLYFAAAAVGGCAWNAWLRDLAPEGRLGDIVARRTRLGLIVSLAAGVLAAGLLDMTANNAGLTSLVYAGLFAVAFATGMVSAWLVARIPEPQLPAGPRELHIARMLRAPFADKNFRRLIMFLGSWQFAVNLATPFFSVYLLQQLGLGVFWVMALSIISQLANILTLRFWGRLSDIASNKSVLGVCAPMLLLAIALFAGASQIADRTLQIIALSLLHAFMGVATAGVTLASANIVLKLSPRGEAASYLAATALATAAAAGSAAILGGVCADFFASRQLELWLRWTNPQGAITLAPVRLSSWDFYFLLSALTGLYALHRLALVKETGEIERRAVVEQMLAPLKRSVREVSTAAGLIADLPGGLVREAVARARLERLRARRERKDASEGARRRQSGP